MIPPIWLLLLTSGRSIHIWEAVSDHVLTEIKKSCMWAISNKIQHISLWFNKLRPYMSQNHNGICHIPHENVSHAGLSNIYIILFKVGIFTKICSKYSIQRRNFTKICTRDQIWINTDQHGLLKSTMCLVPSTFECRPWLDLHRCCSVYCVHKWSIHMWNWCCIL